MKEKIAKERIQYICRSFDESRENWIVESLEQSFPEILNFGNIDPKITMLLNIDMKIIGIRVVCFLRSVDKYGISYTEIIKTFNIMLDTIDDDIEKIAKERIEYKNNH